MSEIRQKIYQEAVHIKSIMLKICPNGFLKTHNLAKAKQNSSGDWYISDKANYKKTFNCCQ